MSRSAFPCCCAVLVHTLNYVRIFWGAIAPRDCTKAIVNLQPV
ncbi:hypothetical protein [Nostoc sp.]